jgi:hypothetical protein
MVFIENWEKVGFGELCSVDLRPNGHSDGRHCKELSKVTLKSPKVKRQRRRSQVESSSFAEDEDMNDGEDSQQVGSSGSANPFATTGERKAYLTVKTKAQTRHILNPNNRITKGRPAESRARVSKLTPRSSPKVPDESKDTDERYIAPITLGRNPSAFLIFTKEQWEETSGKHFLAVGWDFSKTFVRQWEALTEQGQAKYFDEAAKLADPISFNRRA